MCEDLWRDFCVSIKNIEPAMLLSVTFAAEFLPSRQSSDLPRNALTQLTIRTTIRTKYFNVKSVT
jgi:hypothetical protein